MHCQRQRRKCTNHRTDASQTMGEHFTEVLNTEAPTITSGPPAPNDDLDIATGVPTLQEVTHAIKKMKTGKSPGIDNICIELLKTNAITAGNVFTDLFSDIWTTNEIPRDWNKGLIVKIPKKGDLQNCDNWRGITLLSIPRKIFCRVLLNRIEGAIDVNLRQEQAGVLERQRIHGPNFRAPQHHRTKHGMERTTMHWLHRLQESF